MITKNIFQFFVQLKIIFRLYKIYFKLLYYQKNQVNFWQEAKKLNYIFHKYFLEFISSILVTIDSVLLHQSIVMFSKHHNWQKTSLISVFYLWKIDTLNFTALSLKKQVCKHLNILWTFKNFQLFFKNILNWIYGKLQIMKHVSQYPWKFYSKSFTLYSAAPSKVKL